MTSLPLLAIARLTPATEPALSQRQVIGPLQHGQVSHGHTDGPWGGGAGGGGGGSWVLRPVLTMPTDKNHGQCLQSANCIGQGTKRVLAAQFYLSISLVGSTRVISFRLL